jgi:rhamnosyl/mannosyltransferase
MRILHLGKYYPPYKGGMESVVRDLCEAHADRANVTALVANSSIRTEEENRQGVRVIRVGSFGTPFGVPLLPTYRRWIQHCQADVIVHHEPNPMALLSYLTSGSRATFVLWFHSDVVRQRIFYALYRPFLRLAIRRARVVAVASPNHVRFTPLLLEFAEKCCVVPYGVRLERFALRPEVEARVADIRRASPLPIILFVGRFSYYKGLEFLVDAMRGVPARLILAGSGSMEERIRRRAMHVSKPGGVEFTGELSDAEVVAHLHACEVFVLPSVERSEAFGVVQLEAMACGKPVVSTEIPSGVPWVNQHGRTGLVVPPGDSVALAGAITSLLNDPERRRRLGDAGRARVEAEFTVSRMEQAFWRIMVEAREARISPAYRYRAHT